MPALLQVCRAVNCFATACVRQDFTRDVVEHLRQHLLVGQRCQRGDTQPLVLFRYVPVAAQDDSLSPSSAQGSLWGSPTPNNRHMSCPRPAFIFGRQSGKRLLDNVLEHTHISPCAEVKGAEAVSATSMAAHGAIRCKRRSNSSPLRMLSSNPLRRRPTSRLAE